MYNSIYKEAYDAEVESMIEAISEFSGLEAMASTQKDAREYHGKLLAVMDKLFVRGELSKNDKNMSQYYAELKKNKNSLVFEQERRGMTGMFQQSLVLPHSINGRFVATRSSHTMTRMEMGYEGKVKKDEQQYKFSVGLKEGRISPKECLEIIKLCESTEKNVKVGAMTEAEAYRSFFTGERQLHKVKLVNGSHFDENGGLYGKVLLVAKPADHDLDGGKVYAYYMFDMARLANDHWSTKAFADSLFEAVRVMVLNQMEGDWSVVCTQVIM